MNYIGIRGHRGAGKDLISYVVGCTLNHMIETNQIPDKSKMDSWINDIIDNDNVIHEVSLKNVYFDSFGDTVKTFVALLLGCDTKYLYDDYYKDRMVIDMSTFKYQIFDDIPKDLTLVSNEQLYNIMMKQGSPDAVVQQYMITLRDFILYFGQDVMKRFFGTNVWIKSLNLNGNMFENIFSDSSYKIFRDIKTSSEVTYIKNKGGIIINVYRKNSHKKRGFNNDKLLKDKRIDFQINIPDNVYDIYDDIIQICELCNKIKTETLNNTNNGESN